MCVIHTVYVLLIHTLLYKGIAAPYVWGRIDTMYFIYSCPVDGSYKYELNRWNFENSLNIDEINPIRQDTTFNSTFALAIVNNYRFIVCIKLFISRLTTGFVYQWKFNLYETEVRTAWARDLHQPQYYYIFSVSNYRVLVSAIHFSEVLPHESTIQWLCLDNHNLASIFKSNRMIKIESDVRWHRNWNMLLK